MCFLNKEPLWGSAIIKTLRYVFTCKDEKIDLMRKSWGLGVNIMVGASIMSD